MQHEQGGREVAPPQVARVERAPAAPEVFQAPSLAPALTGVTPWTSLEARPLQMRRASSGARAGGEGAPSPATGAPLPSGIRSAMESSFGADFSAVRTHVDGSAERLGAEAYTRGNDIHFAQGKLDTAGRPGRELLGHELAHVVQQGAGRVQVQARGANIVQDRSLEAEADRAGAAAAAGRRATVLGIAAGIQRKTPQDAQGGEQAGRQSGGDEQAKEQPAERPAEKEPPKGAEKSGKIGTLAKNYYDWLYTVAVFDGKGGLWTFFDALHVATKMRLLADLVGEGTIKKDVKGSYQPGAGAKFTRFFGSDHLDWDKFANAARAAKAKEEVAQAKGMGGDEIAGLGIMGGGIGATVGKQINDQITDAGSQVFKQGQGLNDGLKAQHGMGLGGGILGFGGNVLAGGKAGMNMLNGGLTGGERLSEGLELGNQLGEMSQNTTNVVHTAGKLATNNAGVIAQGALGTALGVGAIVSGGFTAGKGLADAITGHQRKGALEDIVANAETDKLKSVAGQGAFNQGLKRDNGIANVVKGATMIVGGALLIALGVSNPVGAIILGVAAAIGGIMAAVTWWRKRKRKQELVDEHLEVEKAYKEAKGGNPKADRDDVRNDVLQKNGFANVDNYFDFYVNTMSSYLYGLLDQAAKNPELRQNPEVIQASEVVRNLGLSVDLSARKIPEKKDIAKRL